MLVFLHVFFYKIWRVLRGSRSMSSSDYLTMTIPKLVQAKKHMKAFKLGKRWSLGDKKNKQKSAFAPQVLDNLGSTRPTYCIIHLSLFLFVYLRPSFSTHSYKVLVFGVANGSPRRGFKSRLQRSESLKKRKGWEGRRGSPKSSSWMIILDYLVGGLEHIYIFHFSIDIGNVIIPTDELHHFSEG